MKHYYILLSALTLLIAGCTPAKQMDYSASIKQISAGVEQLTSELTKLSDRVNELEKKGTIPADTMADPDEWLTYSNKVSGLSFQYPGTLNIKEEYQPQNPLTGTYSLFVTLSSDILRLVVMVNPEGIGFEGYVQVAEERFSIDGTPTTLQILDGLVNDEFVIEENATRAIVAQFKNESDDYLIFSQFSKNDPSQKELVTKILSTFQFDR